MCKEKDEVREGSAMKIREGTVIQEREMNVRRVGRERKGKQIRKGNVR